MRVEVSYRIPRAPADRGAASTLMHARRYSHAVFMAHQAAETAAVAMAVLRLGPHYTASRYPDAADGALESAYNREIALALVKDSDIVLQWASGLLSRPAGDAK